ncbi:hypothetical protein JCM11641_000564 [Rhodosporidiobolus odoratus]
MLELLAPPSLLLISLALLRVAYALRPAPSSRPPTYGPRYLPAFARGVLAIVQLGKDEDAFLKSLKDYGPVVYLPWPMCQYFVTDGEAIRKTYEAPSKTLSFLPIRQEMQGSVFGAPYWRQTDLFEKQFFPVHAKGMSKANLTAPLQRFVGFVRERLDDLAAAIKASASGDVVLDLNEWVADLFFEASLTSMFGPQVAEASGLSVKECQAAFQAFDVVFPLEASGMIPSYLLPHIPDVQKGRAARHTLAKAFQRWIEGGFDGLEEGVVRDMAQVALDNNLGSYEAGKMLVADFWALQANAPFIAIQTLIYLLQSPPSFRAAVQAESNASLSLAAASTEPEPLTFFHLAQTLPLVGSAIVETLRLGTSTFSIRVVEQPLVLSSSRNGAKEKEERSEVVIPARTRLICATRCHHLDHAHWDGNAAEWDGRRFVNEEGGGENGEDASWRSKRAREVYGFGGGISRCEGQHFATAELKAFTALLLSSFDVDLVSLRNEPDVAERYDRVKLSGVSELGFMPKRLPNRVGMGAFQLRRDSGMQVRLRLRQG